MSRRRHRRGPPRVATSAGLPAHAIRLPAIDALRGFALCLMIVYHFVFDLGYFRLIKVDFNRDPFWLTARAIILSSFLLLVGVSLVLAARARQSAHSFWRRIALIAGCAVLVTAASYMIFPQTFITFGVLHFIAIASVLAQPVVRWPRASLVLGVAIIAAGATLSFPLFDAPLLNWVGMMTHKPRTEDYVPLFPWLGVVLVGVAAGAWLTARDRASIAGLGRASPAWLAWLGRHSLLVYMVHQPVLVGVLRVIA